MLEKIKSAQSVGFAVITCLLLSPDYASSQRPFYEGKPLTIIQGRRGGGEGDMRVRAVLQVLKKHLPGKPTPVLQYMPGGGGRNAVNHLVLRAKRDGLTIANTSGALVANAILGARGVKFDADKLIYLGSGNSRTTYIFPIRSEAGFDTLEKLQAASGVRIGSLSVGHSSYILGRLFAWLLDLKDPRFVVGYSGSELDIALLRGEVDGRVRTAAGVLHRKWLEQKLVDVSSALLEIPKGHRWSHPAFRDLRTLESFTRNALERKALKMQRLFRLVGSPYVLPPGVPKERVEILRTAFRNTFKDPELGVVWKKLTGGLYAPLTPEEQEKAVRGVPRDPETLKLFKQIAGAGPLPPR